MMRVLSSGILKFLAIFIAGGLIMQGRAGKWPFFGSVWQKNAGARKNRGAEAPRFWMRGVDYFRLPRSSTVMVLALSAAATVMSLETVISPLNILATSAV